MQMSVSPHVHHLGRPGGRIAFTDSGTGPLLVAVPGMGDIRSVYDGLVADLVGRGLRVVAVDVRGHGDSDTSFSEHGDVATASDLVALLESLGEPAVLLGNSFGGSAAVLAAADRPDVVRGLVLLSPFLRAPASSSAARLRIDRLLFRLLFTAPWGVALWTRYYAGPLTRGSRPAGLDQHVAAIAAALRRPGRLAALRHLAVQLDHSVVEPRLDAVQAPALIVIGALDPDYADPAAELAWMGERLDARTLLVPDAAHYAHTQRPDLVQPAIAEFVEMIRDGAEWRSPSA
jgi:pimeloyl-ACP methyl ester carboxylesterase